MPGMRILTARQMREADRRTIEDIGIPSPVLMENAGRQVVSAMERAFGDLPRRRVAILCGRGNNGGDGFVVGRLLRQRGVDVSVFLVGRASDVRGDARTNLENLERTGQPVAEVSSQQAWDLLAPGVGRHDLVVDALFGTGLAAPLSGLAQAVVEHVTRAELPVVSIDLPSGLSADTHELIGPCIRAALTVTLGAPKIPLVLAPARQMVGDLVVADIGIPADVIEGLDGPDLRLLAPGNVRSLVPARSSDAHKGTFGHVLVVAGSRGKTGASCLAAYGALRCGAGLVTVATPRSCQQVVAAMGAEYMTVGLPDTADGTVAPNALESVLAFQGSVVAAGPGLGSGDGVAAFVTGLVERARVPLVLDADALNAFAGDPGRLRPREGQTVVVTPHPGEMGRLLGIPASEVQAHRLDTARTLATTQRLFVVLKGHHTIVATPDGRAWINPTGNPGMATGGTGDVLTGMIAGWLAQLGDASAACRLGVYLHGAAGDLAAGAEGEVSMTAGDLARRIGAAMLALAAPERSRVSE
jgi:ADP-dependent NAD(P)H-hydrate dehydratase / NAD(P)H-hydrate epimerase